MSLATAQLIAAHEKACGILGETITYRRGNQAIENLVAIPATSEAEAFNSFGIATAVELQDWILRGSRLRLNDGQVTPARGDLIEVTREGVTQQFVVQHPDGSRTPFRRCDTWGTILRIHTQALDPIAPEPAAEEPEPEDVDG